MGNSHSSIIQQLEQLERCFNERELENLLRIFDMAFEDGDSVTAINEEPLKKLWEGLPVNACIDGLQRLMLYADGLYNVEDDLNIEQPKPEAHHKKHPREHLKVKFLRAVYVCSRGSLSQKSMSLFIFWKRDTSMPLSEWIRDIVETEIRMYMASSKKYQFSTEYKPSDAFINRILSGVPSDDHETPLSFANITMGDSQAFAEWYSKNPYIRTISDNFFKRIFFRDVDSIPILDNIGSALLGSVGLSGPNVMKTSPNRSNLLKPPKFTGKRSDLLTPEHIWFLHFHLPKDRIEKWACLYSSLRDGCAWHPFLNKLVYKGSTLVLLKDKVGHLFGCFAADDWEIKPTFYGSSLNFLFKLYPCFGIYPASGYNENYQYLEEATQTLPNGLAMGGQMEYFGLFISSDFQHGHSRANPLSTTFRNPPLASQQEFELDHVEIIQVLESKREVGANTTHGRSASINSRAQVVDFLELAGVTMHAKAAGIEVHEDDDD